MDIERFQTPDFCLYILSIHYVTLTIAHYRSRAPEGLLTDDRPSAPAIPQIRLRIVQTTDLHMHLLAYDYDLLRPSGQRGLANLIAPITALRADDTATLLFDCGDFLQGSPLADTAAQAPGPHPMITAMNALCYDAIVLGNHDFDYGLAVLKDALADLTCPVLGANVQLENAPPLTQPTAIIPVTSGKHSLRVGVIGLTTQESFLVQNQPDAPRLLLSDPVLTAKKAQEQLRKQGADIVIALCHFGISQDAGADNVAVDVAALDGIDAVLAGHTHDVFPGPDIPEAPHIAPEMGRLHNKPAMMAGAFGSHLGVMDLTATQQDDRSWKISDADVRVLAADGPQDPPASPALIQLHESTVQCLNRPVGTSRQALSNMFGLIQPDLTQQILADARTSLARDMLAGTAEAALPILSCVSPHQIGGKDHPFGFIHMAPGPITHKTALAIYPFQDPIVALRRTMPQLIQLLELNAMHFQQIAPGVQNQPLLSANIPAYRFKTTFGLQYEIDVSKPAGARIRNVTYQGEAVREDQVYIVTTTVYNLGKYGLQSDQDVIAVSDLSSHEMLLQYLAAHSPLDTPLRHVWAFAPLPDTTVLFTTSPDARAEMTDRQVTSRGLLPNGLQEFALAFD